MKTLQKRFHVLFYAALVFSTLSSFAIVAFLFQSENETVDKVVKLVFPLLFWLGLILEQACIWWANALRKKIEIGLKFKRKTKKTPGISSFFKTREGLIVDIVMALSVVILAVFLIFSIGKDVAQYILIFVFVLSFRMHCILNGENFRYKKHLANFNQKEGTQK